MLKQIVMLSLLSAFSLAAAARADDIEVMSAAPFAAPYIELAVQFERATGHHVITRATATGLGEQSIPSRIARGESFDVLISGDGTIAALIADGKIAAGSRTALARATIGMAVRYGAPRPTIGTIEELKRTLLRSTSIAYSAQASGEYLLTEVFPRLGIAAELDNRTIRVEDGPVGAVVARGEAEIGFQQISELIPVAGIEVVGPLPPALQRASLYTAGIATNARSPEAARAFVQFLASEAGVRTMRKYGLEPMVARSRTWRRKVLTRESQ